MRDLYLIARKECFNKELIHCERRSHLMHAEMACKNFLFANTPTGAQSSAVIFILIETEKENELDPYRHLTRVL